MFCEELFEFSGYPIPYQAVVWLPKSHVDIGLHEFRSIRHDIRSGAQHEYVKWSIRPTEIPRLSQNPYQIETLSYSYQIFDRRFQMERTEILRYQTRTREPDPFEDLEDLPFYTVLPIDRSVPHRLFPAKSVESPTIQEFLDESVHAARSNGVAPSVKNYPRYPEVTVAGLVSEPTYNGKQAEKVELYGLTPNLKNGRKPTHAMRIRTIRIGDLTKEIYDVVPIEGPLAPGLSQYLMPRIPPRYRKELVRVVRKLRENKIHGIDGVFERLLHVIGVSPKKLAKIESKILRAGDLHQRTFLREIAEFIGPLYAERRGWDPEKIKTFIDNIYKTSDSTRYIRIKDGSGKIVAALGLTTVTYGKVRFFDKKQGRYVETMGPFGSAHLISKYGVKMHPNQIPPPYYWHHEVEITPMEAEGFLVPRPTVPEESSGLSPTEIHRRLQFDASLFESGFDIDFEKPIYFSLGRLIEPVKFGVEKNLGDRGVSNVEVLTQMLLAVFPNEYSPDFNLNGQMLVTYNTLEGVSMYRRLGFKEIEGVAPIISNGQTWYALAATPASVLEAIIKIKYMRSDEAQNILDSLSFSIGSHLRSRKEFRPQ